MRDFSTQFKGISPERNKNIALAILDKNFGIYENTFWGQDLRDSGYEHKKKFLNKENSDEKKSKIKIKSSILNASRS